MLKLVVWDVQHGSAAYLKTPNGKHITVDLGTGSFKSKERDFSPLRHLKTRWSVAQLDYVIITHPHLDHIDDILNFDLLSPRVLSRPRHLTADDVWANNRNADRDIRQKVEKYLELNQRYSEPIPQGYDISDPANYGGVDIRVFTPTMSPTSNINNHSLVVVISFENCKVLLPGDNEPPSWTELLDRSNFREAIAGTDVLIAPHHGRDSGFHRDLFNHISPLLTVISDGRFLDTSATDRYRAVTREWTVHRRNGSDEKRRCVSTRNDGVVEIDMGRNDDGRSFISVNID